MSTFSSSNVPSPDWYDAFTAVPILAYPFTWDCLVYPEHNSRRNRTVCIVEFRILHRYYGQPLVVVSFFQRARSFGGRSVASAAYRAALEMHEWYMTKDWSELMRIATSIHPSEAHDQSNGDKPPSEELPF